MNNTFEAKERVAPEDTVGGMEPRKFRLLTINTSSLTYDFEQAKEPGRRGWVGGAGWGCWVVPAGSRSGGGGAGGSSRPL